MNKKPYNIQPPLSPKTPSCHHAIIHVFSNASEEAYIAITYLTFIFKTEKPHYLFAMAKTRLAPIKIISLARLELNAGVLCVSLYKMTIKEIDLPIQMIKFWTDLTLVLQYIKNEKHQYKVHVAIRVAERRQETSVSQWNHV